MGAIKRKISGMDLLRVMVVFLFTASFSVHAQYFGRNKVQYERFDFRILETPHFTIYHYLEDSQNIRIFAEDAERWYARHFEIFNDTFEFPSPIIIHNNHADFQQTTVIEGIFGSGTGGVTEGYRTRIVMPYLESNKETSHVLGHEMVHVFQYRLVKMDDSLMLHSIMNVPLWMIEGLAEYMSIGKIDAHTAMWMRDAVNNNDVPSFTDMTRKMDKYFPYRYGHAFWAYITGVYGDDIIKPLTKNCALYGFERSVKYTLGINADSLSKNWQQSVMSTYKPLIDSCSDTLIGKCIFSLENAGEINISPAISNKGELIAFLSDKDVINLDIYLANPQTGKVYRKMNNALQKSYIDEYQYLGSSGTWSPDDKYFALATFIKGKNRLLIVNSENQRITNRIKIPGVDAFNNPCWSPNSDKILLSGLVNGQSDLYIYDLKTKETQQLTNDVFSDIQPEWSPDGHRIVFVSDRGPLADSTIHQWDSYRICMYDTRTKDITVYDFFPKAENVDPQFSPDGKSLYFLSNADGFRNLYQFIPDENKLYKLTNLSTGISGITDLSPSISICRETQEIVYNYYSKGDYAIYKASLDAFERIPLQPDEVDFTAATLPFKNQENEDFITENIEKIMLQDTFDTEEKVYRSKFKLEYIGSTGFGVGVSQYETGMYGGVNFWFSDILKRNQIFSVVQVNGEVEDFGGALYYVNKERRINWGGGISHIPYRYSFFYFTLDSLNGEPVNNMIIKDYRTFINQFNAFSYFPVSKKNRFEYGAGITRYSFQIDSINNFYYGGVTVGRDEHRLSAPDPYLFFQTFLAYVGDNSDFGFTSPMRGYRYRVQVEKNFGDVDIIGFLADYRKYFFVKPVSFGLRTLNYLRYGPGIDIMYPFYIGNDFYNFIRGYSYGSFQRDPGSSSKVLDPNSLIGYKIAIINAEFRLPFTGHKRLSLVNSRYIYTDFIIFFDGGLAWDEDSKISFNWEPSEGVRIPVYSTGIAYRFNLFGMLVLEPYYAFPFQRFIDHGVLGLTFSAGGW